MEKYVFTDPFYKINYIMSLLINLYDICLFQEIFINVCPHFKLVLLSFDVFWFSFRFPLSIVTCSSINYCLVSSPQCSTIKFSLINNIRDPILHLTTGYSSWRASLVIKLVVLLHHNVIYVMVDTERNRWYYLSHHYIVQVTTPRTQKPEVMVF